MTDVPGGVRPTAELDPQSDPPRDLSAGLTPTEAIAEIKEHALRLIDDYEFECQGGKLTNCRDWQQMISKMDLVFNAAEATAREGRDLIVALQPFARLAKQFNGYAHDDNWRVGARNGVSISVGDLRLAAAALAKLSEGLPTVQPESTSHAPGKP